MPGHTGVSPETNSVLRIVFSSDPGFFVMLKTMSKAKTSGQSGGAGTVAARYAVSQELKDTLDEFFSFFPYQETVSRLWSLLMNAINEDEAYAPYSMHAISDHIFMLLLLSDTLHELDLQVKRWKSVENSSFSDLQ